MSVSLCEFSAFSAPRRLKNTLRDSRRDAEYAENAQRNSNWDTIETNTRLTLNGARIIFQFLSKFSLFSSSLGSKRRLKCAIRKGFSEDANGS
jgi:hypothetical protein